MVKAGKYWKWPHLEDKSVFQKQNVQKKLNASKVVGSRVHSTLKPLMTFNPDTDCRLIFSPNSNVQGLV